MGTPPRKRSRPFLLFSPSRPQRCPGRLRGQARAVGIGVSSASLRGSDPVNLVHRLSWHTLIIVVEGPGTPPGGHRRQCRRVSGFQGPASIASLACDWWGRRAETSLSAVLGATTIPGMSHDAIFHRFSRSKVERSGRRQRSFRGVSPAWTVARLRCWRSNRSDGRLRRVRSCWPTWEPGRSGRALRRVPALRSRRL